ncbi:hypothetical protein [Sulfolobus acidocaldarius]|uniref:Conserved conjugative plasmid protein n=4 Tax=Sulfolobus acidocaldarius TaxID=2285 RepID=Q4JBA8_SULAC|nr:hypothetical protein [Sulfolobus acidocaldarius]AAY79921.1 conserved conjugative plasmid protein [Sulfolobus acidocaldarius DSM 639]AGE70486.1 conjugative plasmid protein [Sulfolobus acidocaldarius N8]AGE72759.1 conjugative plasmid protein [Sulfolobus acidocaldarius Ron12/I]ALU29140.1 conjugal transfer protein [Sulfolobus acidocaldarius]ALU31866.1 conjugal transfer protein [Sulfolobus acidocaldarius]
MTPQECEIIINPEGFRVNSCTGEIIDEDIPIINNNSYTDFSAIEYYSSKREKRDTNTKLHRKSTKDIILQYILSRLCDEEKDLFYHILAKFEKQDPALLLAIFEFVLEKHGRRVNREYMEFLRQKGIGAYAIRQRKKLLRSMRIDPLELYFNKLDEEKRKEAKELYTLLSKYYPGFHELKTREKLELIKKYSQDYKLRNKLILKEYEWITYSSLTALSPLRFL